MLVETLRSLRTPVPEHTVDLAEATRVVGVQEGTRELPPVDHWGAPAPEDVPVKDQGEPEAKRPPPVPVCVLANESVVAVKSCGLSLFLNSSPLAPTPRLHAELAPWRRVNRNPVHHALGGGLAAAPSK